MSKMTQKEAVEAYKGLVIPVFENWKVSTIKEIEMENGKIQKVKNFGYFTNDDLEMMLRDESYFKENYNRLMQEYLLAKRMREKGCNIDGNPWWFDGDFKMNPKKTIGLSAFKPEIRNENGQEILVYSSGSGIEGVEIYVTDTTIMTGEQKRKTQQKDNLGKIIFDMVKNMVEDTESALLAAQQIGLQKWGVIKLSGNKLYLEHSMNVAAEHGTWPYITNPELQKEISRKVKGLVGVKDIWSHFSKTPLPENFSAIEAETAIFNNINNALFILNRDIDLFADKKEEIKRWIKHIGSFDRLAPGDFFSRIIASNESPNGEFSSSLAELFALIDEKPDLLLKIQDLADQHLKMNGVILDGGETPVGHVADGKESYVNSPTFGVAARSLGSKLLSPSDAIAKMPMAIEAMENLLTQDLPAEEALQVRRTIETAKSIDQLKDNENAVFQQMIKHETGQGEAFSKDLQDVREIALKNGLDDFPIPEYQSMKSEFLAVDSPIYKDNERYKIKDPEDFENFELQVEQSQVTVGNITYEWQKKTTAEGDVYQLFPEDGGMPIAMMSVDLVISEMPNSDIGQTQLESIIEQSFGEDKVERVFNQEQHVEKIAVKQHQAQEQAERDIQQQRLREDSERSSQKESDETVPEVKPV